jgi:hypothetical protein
MSINNWYYSLPHAALLSAIQAYLTVIANDINSLK